MKILLVVLCFSLAQLGLAENPILSKVDRVIVYRSGAQVTRTAKASLKSGVNQITLGMIPAGIDESTILLKSIGGAEITGVRSRLNATKDFEQNPEFKKFKMVLEGLQDRREQEQLIFDTWKEEESLIVSNKKVNGDNSGLQVDQLTKAADLYRTRLLDVRKKMLESKNKLKDIDKEIIKAQTQLNEWNARQPGFGTLEIIVDLFSDKPQEDNLELSYIDNRAFWQSAYDLKLESLKKPLNLVSKGKVNQTTGEDWNNVKLTLSTGNPRQSTQMPELSPWFLYYWQQYNPTVAYGEMNAESKKLLQNRRALSDMAESSVPIEMKENITMMEYAFPQRMDLASGNKSQELKMQTQEVQADYKYFTAPCVDSKVYLVANIPDWEQYNFSTGQMSLYFEGTYIGNSVINADEIADTLKISLGPDIAISTKTEKVKDFNKIAFLSTKKQIQSGKDLIVKNNKTTSIDIVMQERIPLSTDGEMEIEIKDLSGGKLNPETGIVEWTATLKPGEQLKKRLAFVVKIPKNQKVVL